MASPTIKPIEVKGKIRFRFVVDIGQDPKTGKRKQLTRTFDGIRKAEAELARILTEVHTGSYVAPSKITVGQYLDDWLLTATAEVEAATARNYRDALLPVRERLGAKPLRQLTTKDVEELKKWMSTSGRRRGGKPGTGLSPRAVQLTLSRLKAALDPAVHPLRLVDFNVAAAVKPPKQVKTGRTPWSDAEVKTFLSALAGERLRGVLLLSLMGLRPAEVCGLRWSDINLDTGVLKIANTRTLVAVDGPLIVIEKAPKSDAGRRELPIPAPVMAALKGFKATQAREKLAAGPDAYTDSGYVLVDELGRPQRTDWLRRQFKKLVVAANLRPVRLYDARHSVLTHLAMSGVPDTVVSAWAGHSDLSLAKRIYTHPAAEDLRKGSDALAALLG